MSNIVQGSEENPITAQMIFNAAWQRFIIEKAPPAADFNEDTLLFECKYLTAKGSKCAVGLCIPDEHPAQLSGSCLRHLAIVKYTQLFNLSDYESTELQDNLHDDLMDTITGKWKHDPETMKSKYILTAKRFNLTIPESQTNA